MESEMTVVICSRIRMVQSCKHLHPRNQQPTPAVLFGNPERQAVETALRPILSSTNLRDSMFAKVHRQTSSRPDEQLDSPQMRVIFFFLRFHGGLKAAGLAVKTVRFKLIYMCKTTRCAQECPRYLYVFGGWAIVSQGHVFLCLDGSSGKRLIWLQGSSWRRGGRSSFWLTFGAPHSVIKRSTFRIISP